MEENLKVTCLHDSHVALGAKMSPFAGFDMPIQYTNIVDEHNAVRHNVGMFDVSHMGEIFVSGPDAETFVNFIFTNEIRGFEPGKVEKLGMFRLCALGAIDQEDVEAFFVVFKEALDQYGVTVPVRYAE